MAKKFLLSLFLFFSFFSQVNAAEQPMVVDNAAIFTNEGKAQLNSFLNKILANRREDSQSIGFVVVTTDKGLSDAEDVAEKYADAPFATVAFLYDKKNNEYEFVVKPQVETYMSRANCEAIVNPKLTDGLNEKEISEITERVAMTTSIAFNNSLVNQTMIPGNVSPDPKHFYVFGDKQDKEPEKKEEKKPSKEETKPTKESGGVDGIYLIAPCIILILGAYGVYSYIKRGRKKR